MASCVITGDEFVLIIIYEIVILTGPGESHLLSIWAHLRDVGNKNNGLLKASIDAGTLIAGLEVRAGQASAVEASSKGYARFFTQRARGDRSVHLLQVLSDREHPWAVCPYAIHAVPDINVYRRKSFSAGEGGNCMQL